MQNFKFLFYLLIFIFFSSCIFNSCIDEESFAEGSAVNLKFSTDTLSFDTVFTQMGSITKQVLVYNNESNTVKLNSVRLGGGVQSFFRLNVDGDTSIIAKDVEIGAKDSIYIFVKVTVNPANTNNPFLVSDSIILNFNNKYQTIQLRAYGQNAYYHLPTDTLQANLTGTQTTPISFAHNDSSNRGVEHLSASLLTLKSDKPHIIVGTYVVDSAYELVIESGTKLHFANNGMLLVYTDGCIKVQGGQNDPVLFQGIRKDSYYPKTPGQWYGIWLWKGSKENEFENCIIRNATVGLQADSNIVSHLNAKLKNVRIENMSTAGIVAQTASIEAENTIVSNCGKYCLYLVLGGKYKFTYCTFANYWSEQPSSNAAVCITNYRKIDSVILWSPIEQADFINTIIYGSKQNEIQIEKADGTPDIPYIFHHCLLKTTALTSQNTSLSGCKLNEEPLFADEIENDLSVTLGSAAIGGADDFYSVLVPNDINGNPRTTQTTIGAIEYIPSNKRAIKSHR